MGKDLRLPECSILKDLLSQLLGDDLHSLRFNANKISIIVIILPQIVCVGVCVCVGVFV